MKPRSVVLTLTVALVLFCGCIGTTSEETGSAAPSVTQPSSPGATPTAIQADPSQTPAAQPTACIPRYAAGEMIRNADGTDIRLVTKVTQDRYQIRMVTSADGDLYIKKDGSFQEMGKAYDAREFDKMDFISMGPVSSVPVRDQNRHIYGYLEYLNANTMAFERPSPEKLTGDVNYVLEIWYNGDARVYASIGGATTTKTYAVNGFWEVDLGRNDRVFVSVSKDDYTSGMMRVALRADGVLVAEGETNDRYGHVSLSFST